MMLLTTTKKTLLALTSALSIAALVAGCGTANNTAGNAAGGNQTTGATTASKTVNIGYVNWAEDVAASYLWQDILQKKGYTVKLTSFSDPGPLFTGLSENGVNVFFDTWLPVTHAQYIKQFGQNYVDLGKWYQGQTNEGFVVPAYVYNSGIHTISQLEAHASEFNNQVVGIDAGAGEMVLAKKAMSDYNLSNMKLVSSSSAAMLSQLATDYGQHKPIVVTLWSPHWAFTKYNLKYLSDPKNVFGKAGWIQAEANKQWAQKQNPTVAGWMKNFKLTPTQLGTLEEDINSASSTNAGVQKWIAANQSLVNSWTK